MNARKRLLRMARATQVEEPGVKPWLNLKTGRLKKGWRYPGKGQAPVQVK